jgi:hypothetical protein
MNKEQVLKKLAAILDEFECGRSWGVIEIDMSDGAAHVVRKTFTEKIARGETRVDARNNRT